ncbi:MAG: hypothetical protein FJX02_01200 [Alphaproteobacteria bacterium]|nr:hypothetical protein [Alphaproteobacteria bacterium]
MIHRAALLALCLPFAACTGESEPPRYSLGNSEVGVFRSTNAGSPISAERIRGMSDRDVLQTFGAPALDRKDEPARVLRFQSDACTLFVALYREGGATWRARHADAFDPQLRPLPVDQCAGSVAAQRRRVA